MRAAKDKIAGESALLKEGISTLRAISFLRDVQFTPARGRGPDGRLRLKGPWGTSTHTVEVKPALTESAVPGFVHRLRHWPDERLLLITNYVPPDLAEQLQRERVEFVDTAGNAYIDRPIYIFISGRKPKRKPIHPGRAFRPAGLRLVYALLKDPGLLDKTQRRLTTAAGVALGAVPAILEDLRARGYVRRTRDASKIFVNPRKLLFRWEQGYSELLRPKLFKQTCRLAGTSRPLEDLLDLLPQHRKILLGGELGASVITKHLRAETATLHIEDDEKPVMTALRLLPDSHGNITLLKTFGTLNARDDGGAMELRLADPLLIHAELTQTTSDRIQEVGNMILEQHVLPRLA